MSQSQRILIVGGVAGGASAAARLRRLNEDAQIILFERGPYISFANCGLPYYIGGVITDRDELTLQTPESFRARFDVDVRVNSEVVAIDREKKSITVKNLETGDSYQEGYDKLILSPGAEPVRPSLPGLDHERVFTLRSIPDTDRIKAFVDNKKPQRMMVVGGGFIGVEMAENLAHRGIAVSLVEMADQLMAPVDFEVASFVHRHMRDKGIKLSLSTGLKAVREEMGQLVVTTSAGEETVNGVILAIGVRPESSLARQAGLSLSERGAILVDKTMQTNDPDIYAIGDAVQVTDFVTGQPCFVPLAGPANKQGRLVADHIMGRAGQYPGTQGTSILKAFDLTVAATGINEKTAKRLGLDYQKSYTFSLCHAGYYPGGEQILTKLLFDRQSGKVLGAQLVGAGGTDKRVDVLATAIHLGATIEDLTALELAYAPPFSSAKDPVNMAGFVAQNIMKGLMVPLYWDEVDALPRDGSVTLVDVRTAEEYQAGHIDGFINVPVDELRQRLAEIPQDKPVVVTCQVGLRGYVATRLLAQKGYQVKNLMGGYQLYEAVHG